MKRVVVLVLALFAVTHLIAQQIARNNNPVGVSASGDVMPTRKQAKVEQVITQILSQGHYRKLPLNDSLSSAIFDRYIKALDHSRVYFLDSDIKDFEKYRYSLDDNLKKGELEPAYYIFNVFRNRFNERMKHADQLIEKEFDFTTNESYNADRENAPWAKDAEELNDIWRKMVKSQALNLKLAGKKGDEISKTLRDRYQNQSRAIVKSNSEDVFSLFMNAYAGAIDPHTSYFSPATAANFKIDMSNSLEGIGASLRTENDYTKVAEIIPGGPAFKTKLIQKDDRIIGVGQGDKGDIVDVIGWRIDEVVKLIRGPKGSKVRLQILPASEGVSALPRVITLERDKIKIEEQAAKKEIVPVTKNGKTYRLGVISIPSFYMDFEAAQKGRKDYNSTTSDVRRLINELKAEKVDGMVIDLRNNGGGSLTEAINLSGLFIPSGPIVQVRNANGSVDVGRDPDPTMVYDGPLAVLINRFSASASEIFAGAIQDYKRGVVVGEQTYGKGTVQNLVDLDRFMPDEDEKLGQMKLTIAKFYRVTGSSTQHKGVNPDIELPSLFSAEEFGESSEPSALPWDQIRATDFKPTDNVNPALLTKLANNYQQRLKTDKELKEFRTNVEEVKKARKKTEVSLNLEQRKKEREELAQKGMDTPSAAAGTSSDDLDGPGDEGNESTLEAKKRDIYLNESARILADMIALK